jgi:RNA polymerase sigma-70 factor (ECF subfamily)
MPDSSLHTTQLRRWVERIRAGDFTAREEMLRATYDRLERLARKMLRRYPTVDRWEETGDLLHNAVLRLLRALREVEPTSVRDFFGLAAEQMRRELLDLARHHLTRQMRGPSYAMGTGGSDSGTGVPEPADAAEDPDELEKWCAFHEAVERLPVEEREVVGLIYYHGWTQMETAEHLHLSKRSVQRHWSAAMLKIHAVLKDL